MGIPKRMNVEIRNADFMHVNQNGEVVIRLRLYYETRNRVVYLPELILNMILFVADWQCVALYVCYFRQSIFVVMGDH